VDIGSDDDDQAVADATKDLPGLLMLFLSVINALRGNRPITDAATHTKAHLLVTGNRRGFNKNGQVRYGNRRSLKEIASFIVGGINKRLQRIYGAADALAIGADASSVEYRTNRNFLGVVAYRVTRDFVRVADFVGMREFEGDERATGDAIHAHVKGMIASSLGLSVAAIKAKVRAFVTDGGQNFSGIFNGAAATFRRLCAQRCLPARCAAHVFERAMKLFVDKMLDKPGALLKYHPAYYAWRALTLLAGQDMVPYYTVIDVRINELFEEDKAAAAAARLRGENPAPVRRRSSRVPKPGDTRWTSVCRSIDKALKLLRIVTPILPEDVVVGREARHLEAILGMAALAPLVRAARGFVDAAQSNQYDVVSLRARARRMLAHLRVIYGSAFMLSADFPEWRKMCDLGDFEDPGIGGGWFAVASGVAGSSAPKEQLIVVLMCDQGKMVPVWSGYDPKVKGAGGNLRAKWFDAAHFDEVLERVQRRVRAFVVGGAAEFGGDDNGGVVGKIETYLKENLPYFSGGFDTLLQGLDYESHLPNAQGFPGVDAMVDAAAAIFGDVVDKQALRAQGDAFVQAATAAAEYMTPRANTLLTAPVQGQEVGGRNRQFWKVTASTDDDDENNEVSQWVELIRHAVLIPVSTAECERNFSAVKLNLTRLRHVLSVISLEDALKTRYAQDVRVADAKRALYQWLKAKKRYQTY
jgi:hypothetical protein